MNKTRWSSAYQRLRWFHSLRPLLQNIGGKKVAAFLPSPRLERQIDELVRRLEKLDSITDLLQCDTTSLHEAHILLDTIVSDFPETEHRLKRDANIAHSFHFQSRTTTIQSKDEELLTSEELAAVKGSSWTAKTTASADFKLSYAQQALKKGRLETGMLGIRDNWIRSFFYQILTFFNGSSWKRAFQSTRVEKKIFSGYAEE